MKTRGWIIMGVSLIVLIVSPVFALSAEINMKGGEWEITMETKMEGLPFPMAPISSKISQCVTKEDMVPKASEKEENCKIKNQKIIGNKVTWKVECVDKNASSEGEGEIIYSGNSYTGNIRTKSTDKSGGGAITSMTRLTGRRIGECTKKSQSAQSPNKYPDEVEQAIKTAKQQSKSRETEQIAIRNKYSQLITEAHAFKPHEKEEAACSLKDWGLFASPECERKWGKLNMHEGKWEIVQEKVLEMLEVKPPYDVTGEKEKKHEECLTPKSPFPSQMPTACAQDIKRVGNRITWKIKCPVQQGLKSAITEEGDGEIIYSGNSFKAMTVIKSKNKGVHSVNRITRLTGRRMEECATGRDYTSQKRDYTSQPRKKSESSEEKPNPVKSIRKMFGF